jgi:hypothetical protein
MDRENLKGQRVHPLPSARLVARQMINDVLIDVLNERQRASPPVPPVQADPAPAPPPEITLASVQTTTAEHKKAVKLALEALRHWPGSSKRVAALTAAVASAQAYSDSVVKWADGHELRSDMPEMMRSLNSLAALCGGASNELALASV